MSYRNLHREIKLVEITYIARMVDTFCCASLMLTQITHHERRKVLKEPLVLSDSIRNRIEGFERIGLCCITKGNAWKRILA
jgi:hypothetical protein